MNNNSDQIRRLQNVVILEGALAELEEPRTGTGKDGINYISLRGAVQCGDTGVYTRSFRAFIKEKKTNGEDSKVYKDVVEWLKTATPMTKNAENPTMVRLQGSLSDNVYVNREGVLVEGTEVSVQFFNEFKSFNASLQLEGYIKDIKPEVRGKDDDAHETGRYKMHFITRDFYGNTLDLKNIIVPAETYDDIQSIGYDEGATVSINIDWIPSQTEEAPKKKSGGFGKQVDLGSTSGNSYLEMILVGGSDPYDEDSKDALSPKIVRAMMAERTAHIKEVEANGYLGNSNKSNNATPTKAGGFGTAKAKTGSFTTIEDDDELPF